MTTPPEGPDGPEYLEHGAGDPVPPSSSAGNGRRTALIAGGAVAALALVGAGAWAVTGFLGSGDQPATALPAGTLGYASVDLDPSGSQKIEAFRMLNKFPAFKEEFGIDAGDDIRRKIFEEGLADCDSVDYADDVEPWLGTSFAVAAVDAGEDEPSPVLVLQLSDAGAAEDGLAALATCGDETSGSAIAGDWAVVAETDAIAQRVTDDASEGTLADDADYQEWMGQAGDEGVVNIYASPDAGPVIGDLMASDMSPMEPGTGGEGMSAVPDELAKALEDFPGAAATVRFEDGSLELEFAGGQIPDMFMVSEVEGVETVTSLPADTALAYGMALPDGWGQKLLDLMATSGGPSPEEMVSQLEQMSGLSIPEDIETLLGDSAALAVGGDFSLESMTNSSDGSDIPVGVKIQGDTGEIERIVAQLSGVFGPGGEEILGSDSDGDMIALGPNADYRSALLGEGGLGESEIFQEVVPEADSSSSVTFVNFDAGDWLTSISQGDAEVLDNLEPLQAFGSSVWQDGETTRALLKITTN